MCQYCKYFDRINEYAMQILALNSIIVIQTIFNSYEIISNNNKTHWSPQPYQNIIPTCH